MNRFDEISAANGALGCLRGKFIYTILNHLERANSTALWTHRMINRSGPAIMSRSSEQDRK